MGIVGAAGHTNAPGTWVRRLREMGRGVILDLRDHVGQIDVLPEHDPAELRRALMIARAKGFDVMDAPEYGPVVLDNGAVRHYLEEVRV